MTSTFEIQNFKKFDRRKQKLLNCKPWRGQMKFLNNTGYQCTVGSLLKMIMMIIMIVLGTGMCSCLVHLCHRKWKVTNYLAHLENTYSNNRRPVGRREKTTIGYQIDALQGVSKKNADGIQIQFYCLRFFETPCIITVNRIHGWETYWNSLSTGCIKKPANSFEIRYLWKLHNLALIEAKGA